MAHKLPPEDDFINSEPPPSYEDSLSNTGSSQPQLPNRPAQSQNHSSQYAPPPQRPVQRPAQPPQPPRPAQNIPSGQHSSLAQSLSSTANLYTNNTSLPFEYPRGHFCQKCRNTGFRDKGKPCSKCWDKFHRNTVYNPRPEMGFRYPKGFICEKCANTGLKWKNKHSCLDCLIRYKLKPQRVPVSYTNWGPQNIMAPGGPGFMGGPPVRLLPGDPRLGGIVCGNCHGSGQITFFLDHDICSVCGGLGRVMMGAQLSGYY
ncbi:hypothetical protein PUMCH_001692 [Australozyma saopauloensis]|uniref:Proline-rich protein HUA1 n=1 Tax=Australozyma saopauloensis TaxID=291208 RepID=A0AAX4H7F5_9ASCO|nr:hypothetical protein PUMCH_001692 [[Candida] saopauloensis]